MKGRHLGFPSKFCLCFWKPLEWYLWEAKDIKDLRKAVMEDGPNSLCALTLKQEVAHHLGVLKNWMDLAKAVLSSTLYIKWCVFYKEECRV